MSSKVHVFGIHLADKRLMLIHFLKREYGLNSEAILKFWSSGRLSNPIRLPHLHTLMVYFPHPHYLSLKKFLWRMRRSHARAHDPSIVPIQLDWTHETRKSSKCSRYRCPYIEFHKIQGVEQVLTLPTLSRRILQLCQNKQNGKKGHESLSICTIVNLQSNSWLITSKWFLVGSYRPNVGHHSWMSTTGHLWSNFSGLKHRTARPFRLKCRTLFALAVSRFESSRDGWLASKQTIHPVRTWGDPRYPFESSGTFYRSFSANITLVPLQILPDTSISADYLWRKSRFASLDWRNPHEDRCLISYRRLSKMSARRILDCFWTCHKRVRPVISIQSQPRQVLVFISVFNSHNFFAEQKSCHSFRSKWHEGLQSYHHQFLHGYAGFSLWYPIKW
jgi:hypothetical protein